MYSDYKRKHYPIPFNKKTNCNFGVYNCKYIIYVPKA